MVTRDNPELPPVKWTRMGPVPATQSFQAGTPRRRGHRRFLYICVLIVLAIAAAAIYMRLQPGAAPNTVSDGLKADRVNLVLIGVGGEAHPGGGKDLADAIMVLSLKPSTRQAAMISIPRDYYVSLGARGRHRINGTHALGERLRRDGGPALVMEAAQIVLGQPMHGYVRVDFAAFEKIIDELGGIDVYVHRPFYDFLFKDGFAKGWQHMNGDRALRFARYRYVDSEEGNNYARELRQQQVLAAIRDKLSSLSPKQALRLLAVARTVSTHSSTNLTAGQLATLYARFRTMAHDQIRHVSLAPFTRTIPTHDPADPTPAIGPRAGAAGPIQDMAREVFSSTEPIVTRFQIRPGTVDATPRDTMKGTTGPHQTQ